MWYNNYEWHLDYIRLARESSFSFEKTKFPLDKNKICLLDLDKIVEERDVGIIEQLLPTIIGYNVDTNEHIGILDQNFIKLFRMSQLAGEYLLFCKKYLDHTVILLKEELKDVKLENTELRTFNNELKQHTDTLLAKLKKKEELTTTFKCNKCSKAFSTDEYLSAHIVRRHNYKSAESFGVNIEMEIKEIKEKLNNTEKLIKNEELNPKLEDTLNKNYLKVSELLLKFDSLRSQVENDFKMLHTQSDFEEKYLKIIQSALENVKLQINKELGIQNSPYKFHEKRNSITQTESDVITTSEKNVQVDEVPERIGKISREQLEEQKLQNLEDQMKNAYASVSTIMGSSLKNIELQLHALWDKLHEIESKKTSIKKNLDVNDTLDDKAEKELNQPKPKSRKRYSSKLEIAASKSSEPSILFQEIKSEDDIVVRPSSDTRYDVLDIIESKNELHVEDSEIITAESSNLSIPSKSRYDDLDRIDVLDDVEPSKTITIVKTINSLYETEDLESEEEDTQLTPEIMSQSEHFADGDSNKESYFDPLVLHKEKSGSTLGNRSISSLRRASLSSEVVERLKKEMKKVLNERLSVLGVSYDWKGIPQQTYSRVMDILNHQAILLQKSIPGYKNIRKELLINLEEELVRKRPLENSVNQKKKKKLKVKGISSSKTWKDNNKTLRIKRYQSAPQVEIRNRRMYESDSSSGEENKHINLRKTASTTFHRTPAYSAVIEELKQTGKSEQNLYELKDSGRIPVPDNNLERMDLQVKSVLKNFPAPHPVPKKRVLFDLKSQNTDIQRPITRDADGGSTTSVASSVLDLSDDSSSKTENKERAEAKLDIEDFSDSDFSILEYKNNEDTRKNVKK